jgi:4'-phosphopantetheinyl transferase
MSASSDPVAATIDVWHATSSPDQPGRVETCCQAWLEPQEVERANQFRRPSNRNQHVIGRGMARKLLGSDSVSPASIRFAAARHGKPYVTHPASAKQPFNIAHTEGLVLCGIGSHWQGQIGVDVERLGRRTDPELAERFFSQPEIDYLKALRSEQARRHAFLRVWTLKEAFIKAIGTGLQTPLADFAFRDLDSDQPTIEMLNPELEQGVSWHFVSLQPRPGFVGAVAMAAHDESQRDAAVRVEVKCFDDLLGR